MTPPHPAQACQTTIRSASKFPLIWTRHLPDPDVFLLYRRLTSSGNTSFLLESGKGPADIARYSFFGNHPYLIFTGQEGSYTLHTTKSTTHHLGNPLRTLFQLLGPSCPPPAPGLPPFLGGAVGCLSYDLIRQLESLPNLTLNDLSWPDIAFLFFDLIAAIDHCTHTLHLIFSPPPQRLASESHEALLEEGEHRLAELEERLSHSTLDEFEPAEIHTAPTIHPNQTQADYMYQVKGRMSHRGIAWREGWV